MSGTVWFRAMALARGAKKIDCATRRSIMMTVKKHSRRRWKHRAGNGLPQKRRVNQGGGLQDTCTNGKGQNIDDFKTIKSPRKGLM